MKTENKSNETILINKNISLSTNRLPEKQIHEGRLKSFQTASDNVEYAEYAAKPRTRYQGSNNAAHPRAHIPYAC